MIATAISTDTGILLPKSVCLGDNPLLVYGIGACEVVLGLTLLLWAAWLIRNARKASDASQAIVSLSLSRSLIDGLVGITFIAKFVTMWVPSWWWNLGFDILASMACIYSLYTLHTRERRLFNFYKRSEILHQELRNSVNTNVGD